MGGSSSTGTKPQKLTTISVQTSSYGICMGLAWGTARVTGNLLWYGDFVGTEHTEEQGGKGGGVSSTSYSYKAAFALGLAECEVVDIPRVWAAKDKTTLSALGLDLLNGYAGQAPWSYLTGKHPTEALNYPDLAYVAAAGFDLGSTASLPNLAFELVTSSAGVCGTPDAAPWAIVTDLLNLGGFPVARIGSMTTYTDYCGAHGLFLSPALTEQKRAAEHVQDILDMTHTAAVASEGVLKLVPYGDTAATANGYTFTPTVAPIYDLSDDDFLGLDGNLPIRIKRKAQSDAKNRLLIEFKDRSREYATNTAPAFDEAHIAEFGERPAETVQYDAIKDANVAAQVAFLKLQRGLYVLNTYEFRVGWRYCLLEPMDILTLTHSLLGLNRLPVRIVSVEEDIDGALTITAEDFPQGAGLAPKVTPQPPNGYSTDANIAPGDAASPVIFEPPSGLVTQSELWLATSGGANYGGCDVWVSLDDVSYQRVGTLPGKSRHGITASALPYMSDPDTTSALVVDLSESGGALLSGTDLDRDMYHTLCWVGGELISYKTAALTGINRYALSSLRRGAYGSLVAGHTAAVPFVRCDDRLFRYVYDPALIGKTLYIKLQAYNIYGGAYQDLADLTPTTYTVLGAPLGVVSGLQLEAPWTGKDLAVKWMAYPEARGYTLEVWSADGVTLRQRVLGLQETRYVYTYDLNESAGLTRSVQIRLYAISANGQSSEPAVLVATNPQVGAPSGLQTVPAGDAVTVSATKPADPDYAGTMIWVRPAAGFNPATEAPDYDGPDWSFTKMPLEGGTTYYVRVAHYDAFGTDDLTYSSEVGFTALHAGGIRRVTTLPASPAEVNGELGIFLDSENEGVRGIWGWDGIGWKCTRDGANLIANSVAADRIYVSELSAISANMGAITSGSLTLAPTGFIRAGQTGYRTGYGFWQGYTGSNYAFSYRGTSGCECVFDGVGFSIYDYSGQLLLSTGTGVEWSGLAGRPADADLLNSAAGSNANLVRGLASWTHAGTNTVSKTAGETEDRTALIIPTGSNVMRSVSPTMALTPGTTYTISFWAWQNPGNSRVLHVDLFPDTLPEATVVLTQTPTLYAFAWTPGADAAACQLRFWGEAQSGQCYVGNIKLEVGTTRTRWTPYPGDVVSAANPISDANKALFGYVGALDANKTTNTNQLVDGAGLGTTATWSSVSGTGKPENGATVGAKIGTNLLKPDGTGSIATDFVAVWNKMTSGNISTYVSGAAFGTAQIQDAAITRGLIASLAVGTAEIDDLSVGGKKLKPPTSGSIYVPWGSFRGVWHGMGRIAMVSIYKVVLTYPNVDLPSGYQFGRDIVKVDVTQYDNYFDIRNESSAVVVNALGSEWGPLNCAATIYFTYM